MALDMLKNNEHYRHGVRHDGDVLVAIFRAIRRYKHDKKIALNAPLGDVVIYCSRIIDDAGDLSRAVHARVDWSASAPKITEDMDVLTLDDGVVVTIKKVRE